MASVPAAQGREKKRAALLLCAGTGNMGQEGGRERGEQEGRRKGEGGKAGRSRQAVKKEEEEAKEKKEGKWSPGVCPSWEDQKGIQVPDCMMTAFTDFLINYSMKL